MASTADRDRPARSARSRRTRAAYVVLVALAVPLAGFTAREGLRAYRFRRDLAAARAELARYEFPAARRHLDAALVLRPTDPEALLLATQAARREGLLDEAGELLHRQNRATREPGPDAALEYALLQIQRGEVHEYVRPMLEHLEVRHPKSEQILEALAQGSVHVYRLNEAGFWIKQLLEGYPANPVGRLLEAHMHETFRRMEPAREAARRLVEDYPGFDRGRLCLASLLLQAHQYDEAAGHYGEVFGRRPDDFTALLGLFRCAVGRGDRDAARALVGRMEERHADQADALLEAARFALDDGRPGDAERLLSRALERAPFDREGHYLLGLCLEQQGRGEEARRHAEQFKHIEQDGQRLEKAFVASLAAPSDPRPRLEAARICLRNGQTQEGLRWLSGVLQIDPGHKEARELLAAHGSAASAGPAGKPR